MTSDPEKERRAAVALDESYKEQSSLDDLLVGLATGGFGFSVAIGVFARGETAWLRYSWFVLLASVLTVVLSKFLAVDALRAYSVAHSASAEQPGKEREKARVTSDRLDGWIRWLNYVSGGFLTVGAVLLAIHVAS